MPQYSQSGSPENAQKIYQDDAFIDAIRQLDGAAATSEIASIVGCTRRMADNRLRELADSGRIEKHTVGNSLQWRERGSASSESSISSYFSDYMSHKSSNGTDAGKGMVITIRKPHSQAILSGEKDIEFRRTSIQLSSIPSVGFVYEPAPSKALVSVFEIASIEQHSVDYLCEIGPKRTPSTEEGLREYFSGKDVGTAIYIDDVQPIEPSIPLRQDDGGDYVFNPPQDFYYVDPVEFSHRIREFYRNPERPGGRSHDLGEFLNTS